MAQSCLSLIDQPSLIALYLFSLALNGFAAPNSDGFVGSEQCAECHTVEYTAWRSSQHALAMQTASEETVLGDFNTVPFDHFGEKTFFEKKNDTYLVTTANAEGNQETFEVAYTFGVYPLQQYLLPTKGGRLQALSVAWDARPKTEGGQKWFHLYPNEAIPHTDQLHWTGPYFNWNSRCAECHSTNVQKRYSPNTNAYNTTWNEISVGCEACHGRGAKHLRLMRSAKAAGEIPEYYGFDRSLSSRKPWRLSPELATAITTTVRNNDKNKKSGSINPEIDACGGCHSRRQIINQENMGAGYHQTYEISLATPPLYHPDGQVLDENYVLGSFLQSKMHYRGVTCSDCHNPHSADLRIQGNALCSQCHKPSVFDTTLHHGHDRSNAGALCVNCHMPESTYMVVDPRRDHSFRIPRPDQSQLYGTPNACNRCHNDKNAQWAVSQINSWRPANAPPREPGATDLLLDGYAGNIVSLSDLANTAHQPTMHRAAAISTLGRSPVLNTGQAAPTPQLMNTNIELLRSPDALIRLAAVEAFANVEPHLRMQPLLTLLDDPVKTVRLALARQLAPVNVKKLSENERDRTLTLFSEYTATMAMHADMPSSQVNLATFYRQRNLHQSAEAAYRQALIIDAQFLPAIINLADLYRELGLDSKGRELLENSLSRVRSNPNSPDSAEAELHRAIGLLEVRVKNYEQALEHLKQAARLTPDNWQHGYTYAIALHSHGTAQELTSELERLVEAFPNQQAALTMLVDQLAKRSDWRGALKYVNLFLALEPHNPQWSRWRSYFEAKLRDRSN